MFEKILIKVNTQQPEAELISIIKKLTGLGLSEIKKLILANKPIAEYVLFNNDQQEIEHKLEEFVKQSDKLIFYDIQENENLENLENLSSYEVSSKMIVDYFEERKKDLEGYYKRPNE